MILFNGNKTNNTTLSLPRDIQRSQRLNCQLGSPLQWCCRLYMSYPNQSPHPVNEITYILLTRLQTVAPKHSNKSRVWPDIFFCSERPCGALWPAQPSLRFETNQPTLWWTVQGKRIAESQRWRGLRRPCLVSVNQTLWWSGKMPKSRHSRVGFLVVSKPTKM